MSDSAAFRLSIAVQHHPDRAELLSPLLEGLEGADVEVVTDPAPDSVISSPWRTYRKALETTPVWATHRMVVQDDCTLCPHFTLVAPRAIQARIDSPVTLYVGGEPWSSAHKMQEAGYKYEEWVILDPDKWVPALALSWPVGLIEPALQFVDAQGWPERFTADDEIIGRIMRELGTAVWATVPSLVNHLDLVDSVFANRSKRGLDPARSACCPWPDGCDLRDVDWTP